MGLSNMVYLGTYISVKDIKVETNRSVYTCSSDKCYINQQKKPQEKSSYYCCSCGSKLENITYNITNYINFNVAGKTNERLCEAFSEMRVLNLRFFISNLKGFNLVKYDSYDNQYIPVTKKDIETNKSKFLTVFQDDIIMIKNIFGEIEINFGLLCWRD